MRLHDKGGMTVSEESSCCTSKDIEDTRAVSEGLGMPHYTVDFSDDFRGKVVESFARAYANGITPNPCIDCNRYMKFEKLFKTADELGCTHVVTGHYVRVEEKDGEFLLKKGLDHTKDQSYVLYSLTQAQLSRTLFPLGELTKLEAREIAETCGFINADKKDSQDICFVPDGNYAKVVKECLGCDFPAGDYVDADGNVLGRHKGIIHYTVGQHKGLGISTAEPLYVKKICPASNTVVLCKNDELFERELDVENFNWISGRVPEGTVRLKAKIRYRHAEQWASVTPTSETSVHICFDEPQRAITKGQSAVLYDGDTVIGGGIIV
jgi:tRNA-specific 2-thiouridylase